MDSKGYKPPVSAPLGSVEPHAEMLTVPSDGQLLYKMMTVENLLRSIAGNYLHFNRVDAYDDFPGADKNDGRQLPLDQPGNARTGFLKAPDYTATKYYDQSRARTYACCFSRENSDHIWNNYANDSERGKICVIFSFDKLRATLNRTIESGGSALEYNGIRCHQIFSINYGIVKYIDRSSYQANGEQLPNPITYTYLKDRKFSEEKELRISLSALGIGQFALNDGTQMDFPASLQMAFDFRTAIAEGAIQGFLLSPGDNSDFLRAELAKFRIVPQVND